MYEQLSHSILNEILDQLKPDIKAQEINHFYTRLGANFYSLFSLFQKLYGNRKDFKEQLLKLVEIMARQYGSVLNLWNKSKWDSQIQSD